MDRLLRIASSMLGKDIELYKDVRGYSLRVKENGCWTYIISPEPTTADAVSQQLQAIITVLSVKEA